MDVHAIFKRANENVKDVAMAIEYRLAFTKFFEIDYGSCQFGGVLRETDEL